MKNFQYQHALSMFSRTIAAIVGGYIACIAASFALIPFLHYVFSLPIPDANYLATILCYLFYLAFIILSFCKKSARLAWRDMSLFTLFFTIIYYLSMPEFNHTL